MFCNYLILPSDVFADTPLDGWPTTFLVNGHTLNYDDGYGGSYIAVDDEDRILLIQQYGRSATSTPVDAALWFLERDTADTLILQFLEGDPVSGFTDCLSRSFSYHPWGAPAPSPDFTLDPSIFNLNDRNIDLTLAGENVEGRYYPFDYPVAEQSCVVLLDILSPVISDISVVQSTNTVIIQWATDELATSTISYGLNTNYGSTLASSTYETSHSFDLENLNPNTYHFMITSVDEFGNVATSSDQIFTIEESTSQDQNSATRGSSGSRKKLPVPNPDTLQSPKAISLILPATISTVANNSRDLYINTEGEDVKLLQQFLNFQGFLINKPRLPGSSGYETNFFGPLTQMALIKYQHTYNITPAVGYFGPITKNFLKTMTVN
jgi:hypothetical protein